MINKTVFYIIIILAVLILSNVVSYKSGKTYMDDYCVDPTSANRVIDLTNDLIINVNECEGSKLIQLPHYNQ